ncbi:MAG TPA: TRAP transporter substrate-binding protein [Casimicrobiaceae bacterium]|nr:TRAP transporter substrate-binding protein [Casimicrobiaceae bacterium]
MSRHRNERNAAMPERRRFFEVSGRYGFTTAVLALSGGYLWSDAELAYAADDEAAREKAAKHVMIFATEYKNDDYKTYPIPQTQFKANLEALSGNAVYVKLFPSGQLGIGPALAQKVQAGTVQGGSVSLSNFSPFAPIVDVINIPFWCGENQRFANLVTSPLWNGEITPKVTVKGYKPMFYFTVDPRTIATRRGMNKIIKTPDDMRGVKMRVPASRLLQQFYRLTGANPTVVAWGETPSALKQGVADALDPSVGALYTFGFIDIIDSITLVDSVTDAQMFAANNGWFHALPKDLQTKFDEASEKTQGESFAQIPIARKNSMDALGKGGVKFYKPSAAEHKRWVDAAGEQRPEWNDTKKELAGSLDTFEKLKTAANTKGRFTVNDYQA